MIELALVLLLVGVALEVVGLVVTFREVRSRLQAVVDYERRPRTVYAESATSWAVAHNVTATTDPPPTIEQEVASLKVAVQQLEERIVQSTIEADKRSRQAAADMAERVRSQVDDHLAALARLARSAVGRGWRAYAGPALFLGGLLLQAVSNVLQIAAQA